MHEKLRKYVDENTPTPPVDVNSFSIPTRPQSPAEREQEFKDFVECERIWDFLKDHPIVRHNHYYWGRAQGAFDVKNLASLREIEAKVLAEADLPKLYKFVSDHFTLRNDLHTLARVDVAFEGKDTERLLRWYYDIIADELELKQSNHNDGRGVSCVRQIASTIGRRDIAGAKVHIHNEWDKIANYPDIANYLKEQGLAEQDWPIHEH